MVTRGVSIQQLMNNQRWWNGPTWLLQNKKYWPQNKHSKNLSPECLSEAKLDRKDIHCNMIVRLSRGCQEI